LLQGCFAAHNQTCVWLPHGTSRLPRLLIVLALLLSQWVTVLALLLSQWVTVLLLLLLLHLAI
jgi:hypothetical protein